MTNLANFSLKSLRGQEQPLAEYLGKIVLVVNTASKCGFTPQYEGLEQLYRELGPDGFTVLGFPCNQFKAQEPGTAEEIEEFCQLNYGVSFPMFEKIDVNGDEEHPLYTWLKQGHGDVPSGDVTWNFEKFLLDREGNVLARFEPKTTPEEVAPHVRAALAH